MMMDREAPFLPNTDHSASLTCLLLIPTMQFAPEDAFKGLSIQCHKGACMGVYATCHNQQGAWVSLHYCRHWSPFLTTPFVKASNLLRVIAVCLIIHILLTFKNLPLPHCSAFVLQRQGKARRSSWYESNLIKQRSFHHCAFS